MHKHIFSLSIVVTLFGSIAQARDLVIDNVSGSDSQNDRGLVGGPVSHGPYRTINRALLVAKPGDTIVLTKTGKPYQETVSLHGRNHSGTSVFPFRIIGNGAVLDGTIAPNQSSWEQASPQVYRFNRLRPGYAQLLMGGKSLPRATHSNDLSRMAEEQWLHVNGFLFFRPKKGTTPLDHPLEITTKKVGITLYDVEHVIISDLVVRGFALDGINAHDRANEIQLIGVTARHNGRSGISVGGSSSVIIGASLSELNGQSQLRTEGQSHTYLANVDLVKGESVDVDRQGGQVHLVPKN